MGDRPATTFLRLALRRAARGTGSSRAFLAERTTVQPIPDLAGVLGPIRWVLVGGLALRAYAAERMTQDVAMLIHERDAPAARLAFINAGYAVTGALSIGGFSVQLPDCSAPPIDVLIRADDWLDDVLVHPTTDPAGYPVLRRPCLIFLQLQAGRSQALADLQWVLGQTPLAERAAARQILEQLSPDLVEDYAALCTLADLEFGPHPTRQHSTNAIAPPIGAKPCRIAACSALSA